jgi:hypothetical protein
MIIPYEKRKHGNIFCNRSCSASVNNTKRISKITKSITKTKNKKIRKNKENGICLHCSTIIYSQRQIYCSQRCFFKNKWELFKNNPNSVWSSKRRKKQLVEELGHQCQKCLNTTWNNLPIYLEIEHINGNSDDHSRENTTLLCPNCHSQTPTFKALNIGNGRAFRRQRYSEGKSY